MKPTQLLVVLCLSLTFVLTGAIISLKHTGTVTTTPSASTTSTTTVPIVIEESSVETEEVAGVIETFDSTEPFGFVMGVSTSTGQPHLILDVAQWFDGDTADTAMIEDGVCETAGTPEPLSCAPSGFYIRNNSPATIELPLASGMRFIETDLYAGTLPKRMFDQSDLDFFIDISTDPAVRQKHGIMPVRLTLLRGSVVQVKEVYVP